MAESGMADREPPKFTGNYPHALDDKGRLTLPSPLREEIFRSSAVPERLYLSFFPANRHLTLYTFEIWNEEAATWRRDDKYPSTAAKVAAQRLFFANVEALSVDKAGRVLVPASYREKIGVGLGQKVTINGVGSRIEIWSPEEYAANELKDVEIWRALQEWAELKIEGPAPESLRLPEC
jgi:MraZ protein